MKILMTSILLLFSLHNTKYRSTNPVRIYPLETKEVVLSEIECHQPEEVLATIAWHECLDLSWQERWLIMEASWNRVVYNFNNNGSCLSAQLKANKQFPKMFKHFYSDKPNYRRVFDPTNRIIAENYIMAQRIIEGERLSKKTIFYWATSKDKGRHYDYCRKRIKLFKFKTKHIFA